MINIIIISSSSSSSIVPVIIIIITIIKYHSSNFVDSCIYQVTIIYQIHQSYDDMYMGHSSAKQRTKKRSRGWIEKKLYIIHIAVKQNA